MKTRFYNKLYHLYFDLNSNLLESLKDFTLLESNNVYTLESLIKAYTEKCKPNPIEFRFITELYNTNSIGDQETFYNYISDMIFFIRLTPGKD